MMIFNLVTINHGVHQHIMIVLFCRTKHIISYVEMDRSIGIGIGEYRLKFMVSVFFNRYLTDTLLLNNTTLILIY